MTDVELVVADDWDTQAARRLVEAAIGGGGIALSGGSTPRPVLERAAALLPRWDGVDLWWGDERCVPPDDERSNYRLAREALIDRIEIAAERVHRVHGELPPAEAAAAYDVELRGASLAFALLGLGADGHTASLFPGDAALEERERLAVAVERQDVPRVTLTLPAFRAVDTVVFLAAGAEKADAARRAFTAGPDPGTPASLVRGRGRTVAVLDPAAGSRLSH